MQKAIDKLDDLAVNLADQTVVDASDTYDVDHNKAFINAALRSA